MDFFLRGYDFGYSLMVRIQNWRMCMSMQDFSIDDSYIVTTNYSRLSPF